MRYCPSFVPITTKNPTQHTNILLLVNWKTNGLNSIVASTPSHNLGTNMHQLTGFALDGLVSQT